MIDSLAVNSESWFSDLLLPTTVISLALLAFTLFKYWRAVTLRKPAFTYLSRVLSLEGEHFVVKISTSYSGTVHSTRFYARQLSLGFIPSRKHELNHQLKDDEAEAARYDSKVQRTTFRDEQLFWVTFPRGFFRAGSKYKIIAKTSVGGCSIRYSPRLGSLTDYLGTNA